MAVWAVLAAVAGLALFLLSSRTVVLATHDAVLRPNLQGHVVVNTGPVLPDEVLRTLAERLEVVHG